MYLLVYYTWTKVVFPEPAIPRQIIQVGLSVIGMFGSLVAVVESLDLVDCPVSIASAMAISSFGTRGRVIKGLIKKVIFQ